VPTVSDANLVLGRLDAKYFLGGQGNTQLDETAARRSFKALGQTLQLPLEAAALGVIRVVNAAMERALRKVSVEQGHDPRAFVLVPFGGAGPLHACELAQALGMRRVLLPPSPGVLSALGMLAADQIRETAQALLLRLSDTPSEASRVAQAIQTLRNQLATAGESGQWQASLDMRYHGQSYELAIPVTQPVTQSTLQAAQAEFHHQHETRYGYARNEAPVEIVTVRLRAVTSAHPMPMPQEPIQSRDEPVPVLKKQVWFESTQAVETSCYERHDLLPGHSFSGPSLVFQFDCTTVIPPHWKAHVDEWHNLWLEH
jgi:N-methylhydantoinase A